MGRQILLALLASAMCVSYSEATCASKYDGQTPTHTMCLRDSSAATAVTINDTVQGDIVDRHNAIRGAVSPAAKGMMKMVWDDNLAAVAQKWAMQCTGGHDANRGEPELGGNIGQNAARGQSSFLEAVNDWYSEIDDYTYGDAWTNITGHYWQEIYAPASRIGCGMAACSGTMSPVYVCNYYKGTISSVNGQPIDPYEDGTACAICGTCSNNLCDCGDMYCLGGTLDIGASPCTCNCDTGYSGINCEIKAGCSSLPNDPSYCGPPQPYGYPATFCAVPSLSAFMLSQCPKMCCVDA